MSGFIICPECSEDIGRITTLYKLAKQATIVKTVSSGKYANYNPANIKFNTKITPDLEKVLDALHLQTWCCRMHLLGLTDVSEQLS